MSDIYASYDAAIAKIAELEATIEELTGGNHDANKWILRSVYESSERERKRLKARAEKAEARIAELEAAYHNEQHEWVEAMNKAETRVAELEEQLEAGLGLTAGDAPSLIEQMAGLQIVFNQVVPRGCILMNPQDKQGADGEE